MILLVLTVISAGCIAYVSISNIIQRDTLRNELKIDRIRNTLDVLNQELSDDYAQFLNQAKSAGKMTAMLLSEYIEQGIFNGPKIIGDGYVVRFSNDDLYIPEDITVYPDFMDDMFDPEEQTSTQIMFPDENGELAETLATVSPMGNNYYFVDLNNLDEIVNMGMRNVRYIATIDDIESSYGSKLLILFDPNIAQNTSLDYLIKPSDSNIADKTPEEIGITQSVLRDKPTSLTINGARYLATYLEVMIYGENCTVIILNDYYDFAFALIASVVIFSGLIFITAASIILWIYWTQIYIRDFELLPDQVKAYQPDRIRKGAASIAVIGAIGIFLLSVFYQTLSNLNREAISNRNALSTVITSLEQNVNDESERQIIAEDWAQFYLERVAELMSTNPDLSTKEYLEKINEMAGSEFLMLFNDEGEEIASSNGLIGYSLKETPFLQKFADLLNGIGILYGSLDDENNIIQNIELFGSPVYFSESGTYGALLLAINTENTWHNEDERGFHNFLVNSTPAGNLCIVIDKKDNTVSYSSNPELIRDIIPGMQYVENGPDSSDLDTYMVENVRYYGSFDSTENNIVYYLTEESMVRGNTHWFAFVTTVSYIAVILIISRYMLSPYTQTAYKETMQVKENFHHDDLISMDTLDNLFADAENGESLTLRKRWQRLLPEQKIQLCLQIFFGIVLILGIILFLSGQSGMTQFNTRSTVNFILYGNWKRGFNLLGLAAALIIIFVFLIFIFFKDLIMRILVELLDPKGETVCRLAFSLLQYAAVIGGMYLILGYLGFNTTFQITSVGIVSLAISLGSQNIVADILAGIFIIFDGDFQVGDYVEINGFTGIVQEIGVRSTKVLGLGDNIKIIGNQSVKNVLNMSKMNTWLTINIPLHSGFKLRDFEKLFEEHLPEMKARIPEILSGPYYKGVWSVNDFGKKAVHITCECSEQHSRAVQRKLTNEIVMMIEDNGYNLG